MRQIKQFFLEGERTTLTLHPYERDFYRINLCLSTPKNHLSPLFSLAKKRIYMDTHFLTAI